MRAVILAAGIGWRLGEQGRQMPKSLLRFGGESLLERHLRLLAEVGIESVHLGIGYHAEAMEAELQRIGPGLSVTTVRNPDFEEGNVVTLWALREAMCAGGPVLLMDADVLYDTRLLERLLRSAHADCFLLDRDIEAGDEPVKLCIRDGAVVEFAKSVEPALQYDYHGESVGFFKLSEASAVALSRACERYVASGRREAMYEAALRDVAVRDVAVGNRTGEGGAPCFGFEDVTGLPWIEIDFPEDVQRAEVTVLPQLEDAAVADSVPAGRDVPERQARPAGVGGTTAKA